MCIINGAVPPADACEAPVAAEGDSLTHSLALIVTAAVLHGIATYPDAGAHEQTLLQHADSAMYQAKESSRNRYRFFRREMNVERPLAATSL